MSKVFSDKVYISNYSSPIGNIIIETTDDFILSIKFSDEVINENKNDITEKVINQLNEYFLGERKIFDLPVKLNGTDF